MDKTSNAKKSEKIEQLCEQAKKIIRTAHKISPELFIRYAKTNNSFPTIVPIDKRKFDSWIEDLKTTKVLRSRSGPRLDLSSPFNKAALASMDWINRLRFEIDEWTIIYKKKCPEGLLHIQQLPPFRQKNNQVWKYPLWDACMCIYSGKPHQDHSLKGSIQSGDPKKHDWHDKEIDYAKESRKRFMQAVVTLSKYYSFKFGN